MRIAELSAYHLRVPLTSEIRHASKSRTVNETLVVRCRLDDGCEGWGEGLPRTYVTGETIESAFGQFSGNDWRAELGESFDDLPGLIRLAESFGLPEVSGVRDCFGNALRCAVELAVLDAGCNALELPLSAVTAKYAPAEPIRTSLPRVRYSAVLTHIRKLRKQWFWAFASRLWNVKHMKVKVGTPGQDDADVVKWSRRGFGRRRDIRLDVNEAWTCENLEEKLAPLLPYRVSSLEQPVPHDDVGGLSKLRGRIGTLLMLDESLCSESDATRAVEHGLCDLFNLRLSKCGGFLQSLRLAATAAAAGLGYQLGCQVGETGLLSAAGRHFAQSVRDIRYLEGSFDRWLLFDPLVEEDLRFGYGGWAPALDGTGLGITVDFESIRSSKLKEVRVSLA